MLSISLSVLSFITKKYTEKILIVNIDIKFDWNLHPINCISKVLGYIWTVKTVMFKINI